MSGNNFRFNVVFYTVSGSIKVVPILTKQNIAVTRDPCLEQYRVTARAVGLLGHSNFKVVQLKLHIVIVSS